VSAGHPCRHLSKLLPALSHARSSTIVDDASVRRHPSKTGSFWSVTYSTPWNVWCVQSEVTNVGKLKPTRPFTLSSL